MLRITHLCVSEKTRGVCRIIRRGVEEKLEMNQKMRRPEVEGGTVTHLFENHHPRKKRADDVVKNGHAILYNMP